MTLGQRSPALGRAEPIGRGSVRAGSVQAVPSTQDPDGATRSGSSTAAGDGEASGDGPGGSPGPQAAPPGRTGRCDARCTTTTAGDPDPVTPFRQPDQHTAGTQVSNSNSDNAQNTDNGNSDTDTGNNAGGNRQGKQAGVEKGSDKKKKTDA